MKRLMKDEKGQALILTLVLLLIGSLIIMPTLSFIRTGVFSGRVYEQKNDEIYAADAGVEDAMWRIRNDTLNATLSSVGYNQYDYSSTYQYPFNLFINGKNVTVSIQNVWIPTGISTPTAQTAKQIIDDEKLMTIGYPDANASTYDIKIVYYWQGSNTLYVKTLGILLASGFEYSEYSGSCSLQNQSFYRAPTISLDKGGCAVVWNFNSPYPLLSSFPGGTSGNPLVKIFTFKYTGPQGQIPELVACWIDTTGVPGTNPPYSYSWDDTIRLYKIVSRAGGIQIDAYGAKTKFRKLKSAISGDYYGTGNSLITGMEDPYNNVHYLLHRYTSATVNTDYTGNDTLGIPSDATIDAAYLYWTGWIDWNTYHPSDAGSQTRYPAGDFSHYGDWSTTTNMYSYVDESVPDGDTTRLVHGTTSGSALFSFSAFSVNAGSNMTIGLTVYLVAEDDSSGYNDMRPYIRVGGGTYSGTSTEVPTSYGTISYTWVTNPQTNQPWTQDQINGIGYNALQNFGVSSSDANPKIRLTQVYATVGWGASLRYPDAPTQDSLRALVEDTARVNKVNFHVGSNPDTLVTADKWQTLSPTAWLSLLGAQGTWYYTCKADVTSLLNGWIGSNLTGIASNGAGTYTVGHIAAPNQADPSYSFNFSGGGGGSTGYPLGTPAPEMSSPPMRYYLSHAGWSLLILYSCASVYNHQYYLYDIQTPGFSFFFGGNNNPDFDNDGNAGGTISGFLVPPQTPGETNAARITVMVGEGDKANGDPNNCYCQDRFKVNGTALPDNNIYGLPDVWNGNSLGLPQDAGIDIDQFFVPWNVVKPMDVSAKIDMPTGCDYWTCSYMLFQFRSELGVGGVITNYAIKIG